MHGSDILYGSYQPYFSPVQGTCHRRCKGSTLHKKPWRFKALLLLGSAFPQRRNEVGIRNQTAETMAKRRSDGSSRDFGNYLCNDLKRFFVHPPYRTAFQNKRLQTTHHRRRKSRQRLIRIKPKTQIAIPANCLKERASLYNKIPTNSKTQARLIFATSEAVLTFQPAR